MQFFLKLEPLKILKSKYNNIKLGMKIYYIINFSALISYAWCIS